MWIDNSRRDKSMDDTISLGGREGSKLFIERKKNI